MSIEDIRSDPEPSAPDGEVNPKGNPQTLVASHPANSHAARHGAFSRDGQFLEPRAREVADALLSVPHVTALDEIGAIEIGRLVALIQAADRDLAERGLTGRGDARKLLQLRLQASRRLEAWLTAYGLTPRGRVEVAREAAQGGLAAEIARRRGAMTSAVLHLMLCFGRRGFRSRQPV